MSRLISDILQAPEPHFSHLVQEWELMSGQRGIDVSLTLEITRLLKSLLVSLELDPKNTTGPELYYALKHRASADEQKLSGFIGVTDKDSPEKMTAKVVKFVGYLPIARPVWTIKQSVIRQHLHAHPPKKMMKICGYRSIDSLLKRQNLGELLVLSILVESTEWTAKLRNRYKKLKISDFDEEKNSIVIISKKNIDTLKNAGYPLKELVMPAFELGAVLTVPPRMRFSGDVLLLTNLLIEALRERYMYSMFFRSLSIYPKFGERVARALNKGIGASSEEIFGTSWPTLHGLAARSQSFGFQEFGPGLEFDDPEVPAVAEILSKQIPEFTFWVNSLAVKLASDGPVSCHLSDVVLNTGSNLSYENRTVRHLQTNLWNELRIRYLLEEPIAHRVLIKNGMMFQA